MTSWREAAGGHGFGRMIELGVGAVVNKVGQRAGCAPLSWELFVTEDTGALAVSGTTAGQDYSEAQVTEIVQAWAQLLGLSQVLPPSTGGTIEYRGVIDGIEVEVWGVIDQQFFDLVAGLDFPE
ncbi:hypothetical protein [Nocardia gipuzkoensis]|uniref:hypothetical protein n=1 Tax=Nocardia gipuzkoensis TaxID=2749991 RepID=UPI00237E81B0|nr:hypothetical protein [Nocardia gipuzkoensis]MDE1675090.1 hypothetical protein [Nocardia gipuzkoensis]